MAAGTGLSLRDTTLLSLAARNKSAEEMGREVGISPARALVRVKELLAARDIWTDIEQKQLLLQDLYELKDQLKEQSKSFLEPKGAAVLLRTITAIGDILDKQGRISEAELTTITQTQARALVELMHAGYGRAEELLAEKYPFVNLIEIKEAFQLGMREAAVEGVKP